MVDIDWPTLTDDELVVVQTCAARESERRKSIAMIPSRVDRLILEYLDAEDIQPGDPWRQPLGAHDAYPEDWTVTHNGKEWVNLTPANVWEPGVSGWREVVAETPEPTPENPDPTPAPPPEWMQPTGSHDSYKLGDKVTHNGSVWTSTADGNVWEPGVYGWAMDETTGASA